MGRRKVKKTKVESEEKEDLLFYFANISYVVIYGMKLNRIRYGGETGKNCDGCHKSIDHLHDICCPREICPQCSGYLLECSCDPDVANAEVDGFMECVTLEGTI